MIRMRIWMHPFAKRLKKGVPYRHSKAVGTKPKKGKFGPFRVPFGTPKVLHWLLDIERYFVFGCRLDSSSRFF